MALTTTALGKIGIATIVSGSIVLGSMTFYNGGTAVDDAMAKITDQAQKLNIFADQQTSLVNKVNDLRLAKGQLQTQLDALLAEGSTDDALIAQLQSDLDTANTEIATLEGQIANAESNGNVLAQRIIDLEEQITQANADAEELQTLVDSTESAEPMTDEELSTVLAEETSTTEPPVEEGPTYDATYTLGQAATEVLPGITFETMASYGYLKIDNQTGGSIEAVFEPGKRAYTIADGTYDAHPYAGMEYVIIKFADGTEATVNVLR